MPDTSFAKSIRPGVISCPLIVIKSGVEIPVAIVTGVELSVPAASTPKAVLAAPADVAPVPPCATGSAVSNVNDASAADEPLTITFFHVAIIFSY